MTLKNKMSLLLFLTTVSIVSVGFSSWSITVPETIQGNIEVDNVGYFDFKDSAYTIKRKEFGFDYYVFEDKYYYTSSSMGFKIKIRPDLLKSYYSGNEIFINLGIGYEYQSDKELYLFTENNSFLSRPSSARVCVDNTANRFLYSSNLTYSTESVGTYTTSYTLMGNMLLYSDSNPSLYSIAKDFQNGTNYVYLTVYFDFVIKDLPDNFYKIDFDFYSSFEEVTS